MNFQDLTLCGVYVWARTCVCMPMCVCVCAHVCVCKKEADEALESQSLSQQQEGLRLD